VRPQLTYAPHAPTIHGHGLTERYPFHSPNTSMGFASSANFLYGSGSPSTHGVVLWSFFMSRMMAALSSAGVNCCGGAARARCGVRSSAGSTESFIVDYSFLLDLQCRSYERVGKAEMRRTEGDVSPGSSI